MAEMPRSILLMLGMTCVIFNIVLASEASTKFLKSSLSSHSKGGVQGDAAPSTSQLLSIDCGLPDPTPYSDVLNLSWVGDAAYVQTGNSATIQNDYKPSATLRYFPTGTVNCYNITGFAAGGTKLLARATFSYGNYDNASSPPTFKISLDGSLGLEIQTLLEYTVIIEVIYTTKMDNISVCLVQSVPNNITFISTLEFRSLPGMYTLDDPNYAMFTYTRDAFGTPDLFRSVCPNEKVLGDGKKTLKAISTSKGKNPNKNDAISTSNVTMVGHDAYRDADYLATSRWLAFVASLEDVVQPPFFKLSRSHPTFLVEPFATIEP